MGLLTYLLLTGAWPFVLAVLVASFVLVRARQGEDLDLASGATAYTSMMLAALAVVAAIGVARLLVGAMGAVDADYTYGPGGPSGPAFSSGLPEDGYDLDADRNNRDAAAGIALLLVAVTVGWLHLGLRMQLVARGLLDRAVERAVEASMAVLAGVVSVALCGVAFSLVLQRGIVETRPPSPGETIAYACGALLVLLVYGARVARGLGMGPRWLLREAGSGQDDEEDTPRSEG